MGRLRLTSLGKRLGTSATPSRLIAHLLYTKLDAEHMYELYELYDWGKVPKLYGTL